MQTDIRLSEQQMEPSVLDNDIAERAALIDYILTEDPIRQIVQTQICGDDKFDNFFKNAFQLIKDIKISNSKVLFGTEV